MKHSGKARKAAFKLIGLSLLAVLLILAVGVAATFIGTALVAAIPILIAAWVLFALFTLYFFRDPNAKVPEGADLVLSPGHGLVDVIDTITEPDFMKGECLRISMFLSVFDVHVQNAPVSGKIALLKYTTGQFLNALKTESAAHNENVLIGINTTEPREQKLALRLIAGVLARRIVPWIEEGDEVMRGDRISLIQFGSRVDVYLPSNTRIKVKLNDRVVGGETVLAVFE